MAEVAYSSHIGFRLHDFDTTCPITTQQCPSQQELVALYVGNAGQEGVDPIMSLRERTALGIKLTEYKIAARYTEYPENGAQAGLDVCPVRFAMNQSQTRQIAVKSLRKLIHRNKQ